MGLGSRAVAIGVSVLLMLGVAQAQDEAFQKMIGTWQGTVDVREDPERTLVIKSVVREGDVWIASIDYGPTGKRLSALQARVDRQRGTTSLAFPTSTTSKVELQLVSERELRGLFKVSDGAGSWVGRKMLLQKTGDKP
jgi:hypothetical protein